MVHNLIRAYDLLSHMQLVPPKLASEDSLLSFHSRNYIEFLQKVNDSSDLEEYEEDQLEFGLGMNVLLLNDIYLTQNVIALCSLMVIGFRGSNKGEEGNVDSSLS